MEIREVMNYENIVINIICCAYHISVGYLSSIGLIK